MFMLTSGYALGLRTGLFAVLTASGGEEPEKALDAATSICFQMLRDENFASQVQAELFDAARRMRGGVSVDDLLMSYTEGRFDDVDKP